VGKAALVDTAPTDNRGMVGTNNSNINNISKEGDITGYLNPPVPTPAVMTPALPDGRLMLSPIRSHLIRLTMGDCGNTHLVTSQTKSRLLVQCPLVGISRKRNFKIPQTSHIITIVFQLRIPVLIQLLRSFTLPLS